MAVALGSITSIPNPVKFYLKYAQIPFEEDMTHEFKGHKNLCVEELPQRALGTKHEKSSRKSISRNLCGFLNSGLGGTVYCGVSDDGKILGLKLTQCQDHVVGSLKDLMCRYSPNVPPHMYSVRFVPVLSPKTNEEERSAMTRFDTKKTTTNEVRMRQHQFRSSRYCWCDNECKALFEYGVLVSDYVIEIVIKPWNPDDPKNEDVVGSLLRLHPFYENEEGKIYFRNQAGLIQYTLSEIANLSRFEANNKCNEMIDRLQKEISLVKVNIVRIKQEREPASTVTTNRVLPS